jgi:hypothetical protein
VKAVQRDSQDPAQQPEGVITMIELVENPLPGMPELPTL